MSTLEGAMSGLLPQNKKIDNDKNDTYDLQCFPLYSLLLAMDNPTVHYLSLDIEGAEFQVLKTTLGLDNGNMRSFRF